MSNRVTAFEVVPGIPVILEEGEIVIEHAWSESAQKFFILTAFLDRLLETQGT